MGASVATASEPLPSTNELALERNRLAQERTMLAWIRTAVSLISFGFTIYKFFDFYREAHEQSGRIIGPRGFAIIMIAIGLVALLRVVAQRWWEVHIEHRIDVERRSPAAIVAALVGVLGIMAMLATIFRQ